MYKFVFIALISCTLLSCADKKAAFKQSEVNAKIDSIVGERLVEINRKAMEDLDNRIAIEVKAKADSILAARNKTAVPTQATVTDSSQK